MPCDDVPRANASSYPADGPASSEASALLTIGYEGRTQAELIGLLRVWHVGLMVDLRAVANSRRAGFSKRVLAASLAEAGIGYEHLRGLGTPKPGRDAAKKGRTAEMRAIYARHLETPEAMEAYAALLGLLPGKRVALMCFCGRAESCHRRAVTELLSVDTGITATDI